MRQLISASPAVEVPTGSAQPFVRISKGKHRSLERLAFLQMIHGIIFIDTGKELVVFAIIGVNTELVISCIAKCRTNGPPYVFLWTPVEREHHFGMCRMRIAHPVLVLYHFHARLQRFLNQTPFVRPRTIQAGEPYIAPADGQVSRSELVEHYGFLFFVRYFGPGLNDVHILISPVTYVDIKWIHFIFQADRNFRCLIPIGRSHAFHHQLG